MPVKAPKKSPAKYDPDKFLRDQAKEADATPPLTAPEPVLMKIPIDAIIEDESNHRIKSKDDERKIQEMLPSVKAQGILQPIEVYRDLSNHERFHRTFGSRRTEAARRAGLKEIRAFVLGYTPTPAEREERRTIENFDRDDLNPAERALAVSRMVESRHGPNAVDEVAAVLSMKRREVQDCVHVVGRLAPKVRAILAEGKITLGHARVIIKAKDARDQETLAEFVLDDAAGGHTTEIEDLEGSLEEFQRQLSGVLWKLDVAFAGKPACVGCPSNTDSNTDLFGTKTGDARCTFSACYDFKKAKTAEAARVNVEKIKEDVKKKRVEAIDAADIDTVRTVTPEYMEPAALQAIVKTSIVQPAKEREKAKAGGAAAASAKPQMKKPPTEKQLRQQALLDWSIAFGKWREKLGLDLGKQTQLDPRLNLVALWMESSRTLGAVPQFNISAAATEMPEEKRVPPYLAKLLDAAGEEKFDALALADDITGYHQVSLAGYGPELVKRIADVFGIDMNDPKAQPPELEDFLPEKTGAKKAPAPRGGGDDTKELPTAKDGDFKGIGFAGLLACYCGDKIMEGAKLTAPVNIKGNIYFVTGSGSSGNGAAIGEGTIWLTEAHSVDEWKRARPVNNNIAGYHGIGIKVGEHKYVLGNTRAAKFESNVGRWDDEAPPAKGNDSKASTNAYAAGDYVVVTQSKAVGEVKGYVPRNRNTVNVELASGAVRPHFEAELRKATPDEIKDFENARAE